MAIRVTVPAAFLAAERGRLDQSPAGSEVRAGLARAGARIELLLPSSSRLPASDSATARVFLLAPGLEGVSHHYWRAFPTARRGLHVDIGLHRDRGCSAAAFVDGEVARVDEIVIAGPAMERWVPGHSVEPLRGEVPADGRHSRYIGALGGPFVLQRLQRITVLGIAAARLGSPMAAALARAGCRRLFLVDPDRLEQHSVDAVECLPTHGDGQMKVHAVADYLRRYAPWTDVVPLPIAADAPAAVEACRHCDLVVSAPDRDDARFSAALLAVAFHRLHIDLGTGVFDGDGGWRAGADVRFVLPGRGCLLCVGGLDLQARPPADWRRQRAGSLRSLNQLAVSTAMMLFERLVAGDLQSTTWMRIEVARDGTFATRRMPVEPDPRCELCGRWSGVGDAVTAS